MMKTESIPRCKHVFRNAHLAAFSGMRSRLSILIYHRVPAKLDPLFPETGDAVTFDQRMCWLKTFFCVKPLTDAVHALRRGALPPWTACVTFDDGYADNVEIALPILQKHGIPATFFVASGFLDGGRMWNDTVIEAVRHAPGEVLDLSDLGLGRFKIDSLAQKRTAIDGLLQKLKYMPLQMRDLRVQEMCSRLQSALPSNLMMTSKQVKLLHDTGMEIGGHTARHSILTQLDAPRALAEIQSGKGILEDIIRAPVRSFAYPNGRPGIDYLPEHIEMVKYLGFEAAVSTAPGAARSNCDIYQLPRFTPWDQSRMRFILRMIRNMLRKSNSVLS